MEQWKRPNFVYQNILLRLKFLSHILWKAKVILVFSISKKKKKHDKLIIANKFCKLIQI